MSMYMYAGLFKIHASERGVAMVLSTGTRKSATSETLEELLARTGCQGDSFELFDAISTWNAIH